MRGLNNVLTSRLTTLRQRFLRGGTTAREVVGLTLMVFGLMTTLALLSFDANDLSLNATRGDSALIYTHNWIGPAGALWADLCLQVLGLMSWGLALALCTIGARRLIGRNVRPQSRHVVAFALMALSLGTLIELLMVGSRTAYPLGGAFGAVCARGLRATFAPLGAALIASLGALTALALALRGVLSQLAERAAARLGVAATAQLGRVQKLAQQGAAASALLPAQASRRLSRRWRRSPAAAGAAVGTVAALDAAAAAPILSHEASSAAAAGAAPAEDSSITAGAVANAILHDVHNTYEPAAEAPAVGEDHGFAAAWAQTADDDERTSREAAAEAQTLATVEAYEDGRDPSDETHSAWSASAAIAPAALEESPLEAASAQRPEPTTIAAQPSLGSVLLSRSAAAIEDSLAAEPGLSPSDAIASLLAPAAVLARAQGAAAAEALQSAPALAAPPAQGAPDTEAALVPPSETATAAFELMESDEALSTSRTEAIEPAAAASLDAEAPIWAAGDEAHPLDEAATADNVTSSPEADSSLEHAALLTASGDVTEALERDAAWAEDVAFESAAVAAAQQDAQAADAAELPEPADASAVPATLSPLAAAASPDSDRDDLLRAAGGEPSATELTAAADNEPSLLNLEAAATGDSVAALALAAESMAVEDAHAAGDQHSEDVLGASALDAPTQKDPDAAHGRDASADSELPAEYALAEPAPRQDNPADAQVSAAAAPLAEAQTQEPHELLAQDGQHGEPPELVASDALDASPEDLAHAAEVAEFADEVGSDDFAQPQLGDEHWTLEAEAQSAAAALEQVELPPADDFAQIAADDELAQHAIEEAAQANQAAIEDALDREPEGLSLGGAQLATASRNEEPVRARGGHHYHGQLAEGSFGESSERLAWDVAEDVARGSKARGPHHVQGRAPLPAPRPQPYILPSVDLLSYEAAELEPLNEEVLRDNAQRLQKTLADYGIEGHVREIRPGPVVTLYEYVPGPGIKLAKIASLADDLAMSMEALRVRIVAPIPGKGAVGIEIPNDRRETVYFKEIVGSTQFTHASSPLTMALGKDIEGAPYVADLARMPHLLVAGATGAGKSVSINAMIMSVLCKATPEEVRMIMVDPKMLELSVYEGIPHLLLPVVTDPKKAALALRWAVQEMERRYEILSEVGVRNIDSYNKRVRAGAAAGEPVTLAGASEDLPRQECETLPYLLVIVDELADLMMVASREVESSIMRLAQMARAAGIHLVLATQRPSVDVITGVIKANFPTRIAFQVASRHDSRTIIDANGAEHLLGRGDMLYLSSGPGGLVRVHGCYVSDDDIERIVAYARGQGTPHYDESILADTLPGDEAGEDVEEEYRDDMYDQGVAVVAQSRQVSISLIQRRLRIGYNRAARMVERMEHEGIVGPAEGAKPREVLISDPGT